MQLRTGPSNQDFLADLLAAHPKIYKPIERVQTLTMNNVTLHHLFPSKMKIIRQIPGQVVPGLWNEQISKGCQEQDGLYRAADLTYVKAL
jgi:hypothetical protein